MSHDELAQVETIANEIVQQNDAVTTRLMSVDAAIGEGAMALFGEKYGDEVRVVSMGHNAHGAGRPIYSLELCGGTHVSRTGDIGLIKILAESASSAGVRRIEALAGNAARAYLELQDKRVQAIAQALAGSAGRSGHARRATGRGPPQARARIGGSEEEAGARAAAAAASADAVSEVGGIKLMSRVLTGIEPKDMKGLIDDGKAKLGSGVVALIGINAEGRAGLIVGVTSDLTKRYNAVDLVRVGSEVLGGKGGGGRPDMAQAGGPDASKADAALAAIREAIAKAA